MEIFLVGGAVRDFLLARQHNLLPTKEAIDHYWLTVEKDWVVVGATSDDLIAKGFRPVGKSFPVFLHPQTQEEYALARTERKTGKGYTGFECYAQPDVTLEEDLMRRDLTINAIAMHLPSQHYYDFEIIDPYDGQRDLEQKIFRHVSGAFAEDPVRILRVARFASRFAGFTVAPETLQLMHSMVAAGEVDALIPERVWKEWARSLVESEPWKFFEILEHSGAQKILFPDITITDQQKDALAKVPQTEAASLVCLAIELADLTPSQVKDLAHKFHLPVEYRDLAVLVTTYRPLLQGETQTSSNILTLLEKTDAFRRAERFRLFLTCCQLLGTSQRVDLDGILQDLLSIDNHALLKRGLQGAEFAKELRELRLERIHNHL